ncbi:hypothetical protein [Xanthovirga aplysinae]|uniref:hypothetical protein n=1 Tax=Xanthovirga aplysinae TaxID=2529853 RepID=UPI0012BB8503|nr:hypothetical protein [Xanthovirga aplysinae]MTI29648.1 hypothetical protein [Xanthovirga aplysinae]
MKRLIILLLIINSCSAPKELVHDPYSVINDFLKDTSGLKVVSKPLTTIAEVSVIKTEFLSKQESKIKLIAKELKEPDVESIRQQFERGQGFNTMPLMKYGYEIIPKSVLNIKSVNDSLTWKSINAQFGNDIVSFDMPIFNKKGDRAYLKVEFICGIKCGKGQTVILNKENEKWTISNIGSIWVN